MGSPRRKLARVSLNIKDDPLIRRINRAIRRSGSRLKTSSFAATMIERGLDALEAELGGDPPPPLPPDSIPTSVQ